MPRSPQCSVWLALSVLIGCSTSTMRANAGEEYSITSPNRQLQLAVFLSGNGRPTYRVERNGAEIITPSPIGWVIDKDQRRIHLTQEFEFCEVLERTDHESTWKPVWGERARIHSRYHRMLVSFRRAAAGLTLQVEVRAYDAGVAFRYLLRGLDQNKQVQVTEEHTEFRFTEDHDLWAVYSAQGKYTKIPVSQIEHSVERPCVLEPAEGGVIAIAEAGQVDYARMRLRRSNESPHTLVSRLHGPVVSDHRLSTPWRVIMAADSPGELLEHNYLLLDLNQPCQIVDTDWIRPGKVIREVTLSTDGGKACVDFAVQHGLQYIEYDAGWYGDERDDMSDARTVSRPNLDLPAVLEYAQQRDIGVILYVNRRHLERQLDELLPLYKEWGVAGLKFGFVQHGSQEWTKWMHDAIAKAADHQLMVDVHDEYRMTGWQRTYPNFMTAEGIGGDETRPTNEQALANLFTRMIAAPADHTFCYFNGYVDQTTSHASQLAKTVCFFSPWQFLFWYDRPAQASDEPELEFFRHLPTTWDETRVLHGKIGEYAVVARRYGEDWFVGCLNAIEPRSLNVLLTFLSPGRKYVAHLYRDDPTTKARTKVAIERRQVNSATSIRAVLSQRGGMAMRIVPLGDPTSASAGQTGRVD